MADGTKKRGALLFAVVGAKLSEGLNFTDDLARAVVIVGLPFANLGSPELRERMSYVNRLQQQQQSQARGVGAKDAGTELYENMCMNAVNQSIGAPKLLLVLRRGRESSTSVPVPGCRSRDPTSGGLGRAGARRRPVRFAADTGQVAQVDRGWDCCHGGLQAGYEGAGKVLSGEEGRMRYRLHMANTTRTL